MIYRCTNCGGDAHTPFSLCAKCADKIDDQILNCYAMVQQRTLWRKTLDWAFPQHYLLPAEHKPGLAEGELMTDVYMQFDWLDRLRLLVSGKMHLSARSQCDVIVSEVITRSVVSVLDPWKKVKRDE